jgi:hypothetical protein
VSDKRDYLKALTGQTRDEIFKRKRRPYRESLDQIWKGSNSKYPLRLLGTGDEQITISEEEREAHTHILGTTRQGKSKFLEYLIREDIRRGIGLCFLDPTDNAQTAYNILNFCCDIGYEKVCLIDFTHHWKFKRLPVINPFHYEKYFRSATTENILDAINVLFNIKDPADTSRITYYIQSLIGVLHSAEMTLHESKYFFTADDPTYMAHRMEMLAASEPKDLDRKIIESVFKNRYIFNQEFQTSIRRLKPIFQPTLDLMLSGDAGYKNGNRVVRKSIDFMQMISDGWVVLVNLCPQGEFNMLHTRLLGTMIINEICFAMDRLVDKKWKGVYYLYLDEAGRFANLKLADVMAHKLKWGLRVTIAHQFFSQFRDSEVIDAITHLCGMKILFHTHSSKDRERFLRDMYGGKIPPEQASYAFSNIPKQYAIVKTPKGDPRKIQIPFVDEIKKDQKVLDDYIMKLYQQPWYRTPKEIDEEIHKRFNEPTRTQGTDPKASRPGASTNRRAGRKAGVSDNGDDNSKWKSVS